MGILDAIVNAVSDIAEIGLEALQGSYGEALSSVSTKIISTPHPLPDDALFTFSPPESGIWAALWGTYQYMLLVTTALMILAVAFILLSGTYSNDAKSRRSLREVLFWYPVAMSWWWIGGIFLKFTHVTTQTILSGAGAGLGFVGGHIAAVGGGIVIALLIYFFGWGLLIFAALVYYARWALVHIYHVLMPPLLMLRVFPYKPVQSFADTLVSKYPPIVLTTIPVAILLRVGVGLFEYPDLLGGSSFAAPFLALTILIIAAIIPKFTMEAAGSLRRTSRKGGQIARGMATGGSSVAHNMTGTTPNPEGGQQTLNSGVDADASPSSSSGGGSSRSGGLTDDYDQPDPHALDPGDMNFAARGRRRRNRRGAKLVTSSYKAAKQAKDGVSEEGLSGLKKPFKADGEIGGNSGVRLAKGVGEKAGGFVDDKTGGQLSNAVDYASETAREKLMSSRSEAAQMSEDDINRDASFDDFEDTVVPERGSSEEGVWADLDGVEDSADDGSDRWGEWSGTRTEQMVASPGGMDEDTEIDEQAAEQVASDLTDEYDFESMTWGEREDVLRDELGWEENEETDGWEVPPGGSDAEMAAREKIEQQTGEDVFGNIDQSNWEYEYVSTETDEDNDDAPESPPMPGSGGTAAEAEQTTASGASTPDPEPPSPDELQTEETSYSDLSKPTAHEVATNRDTSELSEAEAREEFESRFTEMDHNGDAPPTDADIENGLDALEEHPTSNFEREDAEETGSSQSGDTPAMVGTDADPMVEEEQTVSESRAEAVDNQYVGLSGQSTTPSSSEQAQTQTTTSGEGDGQSAQNDLEPHQEAVQEHLETTKQSAEEVSPVEVAGKLAMEDDRVGEPNEVTDYVKQLQED